MRFRCALLLLVLAALPAAADIALPGAQHIGNDDTKGDASALFVPTDPVGRPDELAFPSRFHLSQGATITAVRLTGAIGLDGDVDVWIDGVNRTVASVCVACSTCTGRSPVCGDFDIALDAPLTLGAGVHTIALDGKTNGNDIGFSGLVLVSAQASTSRMFNRRRNIGDDNDGNDEYDIDDTDSPWYPDDNEGAFLELPFTLDANRRLVEIRFYRLRDVDTGNGQVLVDGLLVGNLPNTGDPLETAEGVPASFATNLLLLSGAHTLRVNAGTIGAGDLDTISWDDIILIFSEVTTPGTPGFFNAVDPPLDAVSGWITTKVAGGALELDLYALNGFGAGVNTGYNGTANVFLLNAGNNSGVQDLYGCRTSWEPPAQALGAVTFTAGKATLTGGTLLDAGLREARIRLTDTATGASGCSIDNFAVRPATFGAIVVSHDSETLPGTTQVLDNTGNMADPPRHKAGRPFTIRAEARAAGGATATGYSGTPDETLATVPIAPATVAGQVTAATSDWTNTAGVLRTDNARYSEAGPFTLQLTDDRFADVDLDDTPGAARRIGPGTQDVGRFIPDHFTLTPAGAAPAFVAPCATYTYAGQPFAISPAPFAANITAVTALGTATRNYTNAGLYKLPSGPGASLPATSYPALTGAVGAVAPPTPDNTLTNQGAGVTRWDLVPTQFQFTRGVPVAPFDAEVAIEPGALGELDGIDFAPSPGRFGAPAAGGGIAFLGGGANPKEVRFGRLVIDNAHGSERLPLDVPLRTEYWADVLGGAGFVLNLADDCTQLPQAEIVLTGDLADGAPNPDDTSVVGYVQAFTDGRNVLRLAAPNDSGQAVVQPDLTGALLPWLKLDVDGDASYDDDPLGVATFGIARDQDRRIYQREVIGY